MERVLDLTGMRSGKLTALYRLDEKKRNNHVWLARCDCGNYVKVIASDFLHGKIKSCGCSRKGKNVKDLQKMQFGKLTAIKRLPEKKGSSYLWLCLCSCGNTITATASELLNGHKKSCGCLKTEQLKSRAKDLTGKQFGKLTVLYPTERRLSGSVIWICRCDCGTLCEASANELTQGNKKSCGCIKKEHPGPSAFSWKNMTKDTYQKRKLRSDNTSGYTGVQKTRSGKWHAFIMVEKKTYHLGIFEDIRQAVYVRRQAEALVMNENEIQDVQMLDYMLHRVKSQWKQSLEPEKGLLETENGK